MERTEDNIIRSTSDLFKTLVVAIQGLNKLVPSIMTIFAFWTIFLVYKIGEHNGLMLTTMLIITLICSVLIYFKNENYGEAVLSLSAGLFTIFSVTWTSSLFLAYIFTWMLFTISSLMISSLKLALRVDEILHESALIISNNDEHSKRKVELRSIVGKDNQGTLGIVEKSEVIRVFCFMNLKYEYFEDVLRSVIVLNTITRINYMKVCEFYIDIVNNSNNSNNLLDTVYLYIRQANTYPENVVDKYLKFNYLIHSQDIEPVQLLSKIVQCINDGYAESDYEDTLTQLI